MKVSCQEVFAPVVIVEPYDEFADAIRRVNDSPYRIAGRSIHARCEAAIFDAFENLEVGGVIAGDMSSFRIDHMPYGGVKDSGAWPGRVALRD